jgi:hypothetical protein
MPATVESPFGHAPESPSARYARCIAASRRVRWDIDRDVIRGRRFDLQQKFLPDTLTRLEGLPFLDTRQRRLMSQIQGRTYANMVGLVERFIGAKMLEVGHEHALGDQVKMEALVRFTDEELKHQELFRRIERLAAEGMPSGYLFMPEPNAVAGVVLAKSTWAVLALTCHIELFTQVHYRESIAEDCSLSGLYRDVFLFHWKEEAQHAILDELEWTREDTRLNPGQRDRAVDDFIELMAGIDGLLQAQARSDAAYFAVLCGKSVTAHQAHLVEAAVLAAYRWQYIASGAQHPRFQALLAGFITPEQGLRVQHALAPLLGGHVQ